MSNIDDYLDWRADVSLEASPFNEVDNAILSILAYTEFEGVLDEPGCGKMTIENVTKKFFELHTDEELNASPSPNKDAPFLLRKMAGSNRYKGTKLGDYVAVVDLEAQTQFSALTYYLPDNSVYIAYRGTDITLIGWKEDMNMCFMPEMPGQRMAVEYLERIMKKIPEDKTIYVGGHSKGGHFALYAASFCEKEYQDRIKLVYSNDGPGLIKERISEVGYKRIYKRVKHIIPEFSVFGVLMEHKSKSIVIASSATGVAAHGILTWQVLGTRFVRSETRSDGSVAIDKFIKEWMYSVGPTSRKLFWEAIYEGMEAGGETLPDLQGSPIKTIAHIVKAVETLPEEEKKQFRAIMKKGGESGSENLKAYLMTLLPNNEKKVAKKSMKTIFHN